MNLGMIARNGFGRKLCEPVVQDAIALNLEGLGLATRIENGYNLNTYGYVI